MEFIREIRQVDSTDLSVKLPESFVHQEVEILILPYHSERMPIRTGAVSKRLPELEELRQYYRTVDANVTFQAIREIKEELYRDLF